MFDRPALDRLLHWMERREAVRLAKEMDLMAVSDDPIIATWRFCNVNRNDDRVTRWIFRHVIAAHRDSSTLWFNLCIARFLNWPPTIGELGYYEDNSGDSIDGGRRYSADHFAAVLGQRQTRGDKVYTGAYLVPSDSSGRPRHLYLAGLFQQLWDYRDEAPKCGPFMADTHTYRPSPHCSDWSDFLRRFHGMGDFMRNQVITDLKYSRYLPSSSTADWTTFCLAGPGTRRGLNRCLGQPIGWPFSAEDARRQLISLRVALHIMDPRWDPLLRDLNNLSNCMCEFDKYERVRLGEGQPRSRYRATPEALP